ncbi:DUF5996 family protein [Acuticoccus sp.]|uniref:DUF5996 family protein n=1 Tax=Acuticoccus sp. TaxID=1904378 RepID=UPI003B528661
MSRWPEIPYAPWQETCRALHLYCQIIGKYRLAHTPWINHSWHATLYPTPRGLTTGTIHDPAVPTEVRLDVHEGAVIVEAMGGQRAHVALGPMSVADFFDRFRDAVRSVGGTPTIDGAPNEVPDPTPFREDCDGRPYDGEEVRRWHRALASVAGVLEEFRSGWLGKVSPVHLFWGSFDLAVTRFSGREAPRHPGGMAALPDAVTWEAYSHEVSSAGFWPGGGGVDEAMVYAYAYPTPEGFGAMPVAPAAARYDETLGEFLLPYEALARSDTPRDDLLAFLDATYRAAAERGGWHAAPLEAPRGVPRVPRPV